MDECRVRRTTDSGALQTPVAYLTCNFNRPVGDKPALFTHDEVTTLFHEFGHGIHHMLTQVEVGAVSGINGVPWDAVELPSQFLETGAGKKRRWRSFLVITKRVSHCRKPCSINAGGEKLPIGDVYSASVGVRIVRLHAAHHLRPRSGAQSAGNLGGSEKEVAVLPGLEWNRFSHSFSHILRVATAPVTTATCGQKCFRRMHSHALKKKAFSTVRLAKASSTTSLRWVAAKSRWSCLSASVAANHKLMLCCVMPESPRNR